MLKLFILSIPLLASLQMKSAHAGRWLFFPGSSAPSFTDLLSSSFVAASSQSVSYGNVADESGSNAFSLSLWVNPSGSANGGMFAKTSSGSTPGQYFSLSSGTLYWSLVNPGGQTYIFRAAPTANVWTHLVATYDGSGLGAGMKLFYNDTLQTTTLVGVSVGTITSTAAWLLGTDNDGDGFYGGLIDDVSKWPCDLSVIYSGSTGVSQVYNSGLPGDITTTNAYSACGFASSTRSMWVTFEGNSWNDVSPNAYTGTPINSPTFSSTVP